jgi:hypothetical protein
MARILRHSAFAMAIVSVVSLVSGAFLWERSVRSGSARGGLQVEPLNRSLGDLSLAAHVPLIFKATNSSSEPIRVIGIKEVCTNWGCLEAENLPCVVPPRSSAEIALSMRTTIRQLKKVLAFEYVIDIYSDRFEQRVTPVHISGRVIPASSQK